MSGANLGVASFENDGLINDYCGATVPVTEGFPPQTISCFSVTFGVSGLPAGATWGVTISWPFGTADHAGTGTSIALPSLGGSVSYSYDTPVTSSGAAYNCASGCSGTVDVTSDTTFTATYSPPLAAPTISAPPAIDGGQSATLSTTSSFSGGMSPYACQWLEGSATWGYSDLGGSFSCSPGDTPSIPTGPLAAGSHSFELQVTDSSSPAQVVVSDAVTVTVNPQLVAPTISASAGGIDQGQATGLTSTPVSTGTPPYSYQWYEEAPGGSAFTPISGATSSTYNFATASSTSTGAWSFELGVTDGSWTPETVTSAPVLVTVYADPTVAVSPPGPLWYVVGQSAPPLSAAVTYTGPNAARVEWYSSSTSFCASSSTDTGISGPSFTPGTTSPGTEYYCAVVSDSGVPSYSSASNPVEVDVLSPSGAIQQLNSTVNGMHLPQGTNTSLDAKLTAALSSLNGGNTTAAVNQLNAFVHEVNAQTGKKITADQAQILVYDAKAIISAISP